MWLAAETRRKIATLTPVLTVASRRSRALGPLARRGARAQAAAAGLLAILLLGCGTSSRSLTNRAASTPEPHGVQFQPIDGGPHYFAGKSQNGAWLDSHILIGGWLEQPQSAQDVSDAVAMGENIYWNLAGNPGSGNVVDYNVIRAGGMHVSAPSSDSTTGPETVAWDGSDEADMDYGPGASGWNRHGTSYNSSDCVPSGSKCGYTAASFFYTGRPATYGVPAYRVGSRAVHQGFGKGVLFWESNGQAARFLRFSDVLSADSYWLTDPDLQTASQGGCGLLPHSPSACGGGGGQGLSAAQAQLPANYSFDVTRLEHLAALDGGSKPVVVDVETGCPFANAGSRCATPAGSVAAAWHALIAGARGIIWFQHNFSGPCVDYRTFIDGSNPASGKYNCQQTPGVTLHRLVQAIGGFDRKVAALNDVLLAPKAVGYAAATGDVSLTAKVWGGACYVFAGSGQPATPPPVNQSVTFRLADPYNGPVSVYGENRLVHSAGGVFRDTFADADSVHIYRVHGGRTCRAPVGSPRARR